MNKRYLELLAPARDLQTAKRAILSGADAVYIGGPAFGARAAAKNSLEDLKEICTFAHLFGAKVHLTLNTLFYDNELIKLQELLLELSKIDLDVLIVQDPALFECQLPDNIEIHASTQCLIKTPERLRFFYEMGVCQAVLPRELSLKEIRALHESCPDIRLEAFVAGALCVSESGNCFISELMTGRSANRGECAQICRLPMSLYLHDKEIAYGHLLSLKDNLAADRLEDLIAAGVSSFKIEGRLKDAAYVTNLTAYFRAKLDKIISKSCGNLLRASKGSVAINFVCDPQKTFNRGFTSVMLDGGNKDMVNIVSPKFIGPEVAVISKVRYAHNETIAAVEIKKGVKLNNGDGLTYISPNSELLGFRINSINNNILSVRGKVPLKPHETLYRNVDSEFLNIVSDPKAVQRSLSYKLKAVILKDKFILETEDELGRKAHLEHENKTAADFVHYSLDRLAETLKKRVDPNTNISSLEIDGDTEDLYLPLSFINKLRREVLTQCFSASYRRDDFMPFVKPKTIPKWPEREVDPRLCLNEKTRSFYEKAAACIGSSDRAKYKVVMTCRHCLVKSFYKQCVKDGAPRDGFSLKIGSQSFKIRCDCVNCRMMLIKP